MIGINFDTKLSVTNTNKKHYPILFSNNTCTVCGSENTLKVIDKFGNISKSDIKPLDHIKCMKCGALYGIKWDKEDPEHRMTPSAVDPNLVDRFFDGLGNIINNTKDELSKLL